jgi:very-short-patch-repair endonuclease
MSNKKCENYNGSEYHLENLKKASKMGLEAIKRYKNERISDYNLNPKKCLNCNAPLEYENKHNKFCNSSCAATYNNKKRGERSEETKEKIKDSLQEYYKNNPYNNLHNITQLKIYPKKYCLECGNELSRTQIMKKRIFCSNKCSSKNKGKNEDYKEKLRKSALERIKQGKHNGWNSRKIISFPEQFFTTVLNNNKINYKFNFKIKHSELKNCKNKSYYFLDFFLIDKNIDLEIDGKQHDFKDRKEKDKERDWVLTNNGFIVYRIKWKSVNNNRGKEYIKNEIDKFINFYNNI